MLMNRNTSVPFATTPVSVDMPRSRFDRTSEIKTTFNTGALVPFYVDEVLPGDTFSVKTAKVVRMQTLLTPMMDNLYLDTYYFYVPNRLVWKHWRELNGENTQSAWIPSVEYSVPQTTAPAGGWKKGTIADYMGIPTDVDGLSVNSMPFRAYAMIVNEWFRSENLQNPVVISDGDATTAGSNGNNYITDLEKGGSPFVACKLFDYFSAALPAPQKGPDVPLPLTNVDGYGLPVIAKDRDNSKILGKDWQENQAVRMAKGTSVSGVRTTVVDGYLSVANGALTSAGTAPQSTANRFFTNLYAVPDGYQGTINELRQAFQIQKLLERDAIGGTRYTEILRSHFRVTSPDARLQRPEYLGGNRITINVNQIIQQSESTSSSPLGNVAGQSLTTDVNGDFSKSFVEHGFVIGVMVARYNHTYQQGLERFWSRKTRFDYYWPVFANIGNQPILNKEIYATGTTTDDEVFGYQEAWADYRYKPSRVSGEMRSNYAQTLDSWHLADDYNALPQLGSAWIVEDKTNVDRVLAVTSQVSDQLFADILVKCTATRPMPMYSVPGLLDHH